MDLAWYGYCLLGLCFLGFADYIKKIVTINKYDKDVFLLVCFILYTIWFGLHFLFVGDKDLRLEEIKLSIPAGIFDFMIPLGMLAALKYTDSSLAFVTIRMITSFVLLAIGSWYFGDNLHFMNLLGFALGIFAIYLLSGYEYGKKHKVSQKGIIGMGLSIIGVIGAHSYLKYVVDDVDIPSFMFLKFTITAILVFLYFSIRGKWKNFTVQNVKKVLGFAGVTTILVLIQFSYILPKMFSLGPLSISYKILSYSLIIPILLSVIFYGEKLTYKKGIAFFLTFISLLFFFF